MYNQEAAFAIQVELALGCNLGCSFCGINGIGYEYRKKGFKFMSLENAEIIAKKINESGFNSRVEFARRGEPTLNPELFEIIKTFSNVLPNQLMITTNGGGLLRGGKPIKNILKLFKNGLNILAMDDYQDYKIGQKLRAEIKKNQGALKERGICLYEYPENKKGNPHRRVKKNEKFISLVYDISKATTGTHSKLNNHAGYASKVEKYNKPCAKPFRELSIDYNGKISKCCITWGGEYIMGDLLSTQTLQEIWNNEKFYAVRQKLIRGERDFGLCNGCNHPSYRVGLLPDKKGKDKSAYPLPNQKTDLVLKGLEKEGFQEQPNSFYYNNRKASQGEIFGGN